MLFAALLKTEARLAAHVFYRLGAQPRNRMLEALLTETFKDQYDAFLFGTNDSNTTSLFRLIRNLDERRHQLAHWAVVAFSYPKEQKDKNGLYLVKPEHWASKNEPTKITADDMLEFSDRGAFVAKSVGRFYHYVVNPPPPPTIQGPDPERDAWLVKFSQPIPGPPYY
jgi:hypothetical protein